MARLSAGERLAGARDALRPERTRPAPGSHPPVAFEAMPQATWLYRALLRGCRIVAAALGWRMELRGADHLPVDPEGRPAGGWIAAGIPHRTWVEPFVLAMLLPAEPRLVFLGDARAIVRSPIRRALFRAIGGVVPIWPGGGTAAFRDHVEVSARILEAGAVFALFPEVGPAAPVGTARPLSPGIGYIALRTGAPIVPLVLGGTHELYLRRRIVVRVLPAVDGRDLAGLSSADPAPRPNSREEREAAHRVALALRERTAADVEAAWRAAEPRPGAPRRWRWLSGILH